MRLYFISDIHKGKAFPYATTVSRTRFRQKQLVAGKVLFGLPGIKVGMGDLFDSYLTSVPTLMDGAVMLADATSTYLMAGNHDKSKNRNDMSSFQYLEQLSTNSQVKFVYNEPVIFTVPLNDNRMVEVYMIPHQLTQELFDAQILKAAESKPQGRIRILVLHCNQGDFPGKQSENYLTTAQLSMLAKFDKIVSGHEHGAKRIYNMEYPGSVVPCSFGEFNERYLLYFDTSTCEFGRQEFDTLPGFPSFHYRKMTAQEFLADDVADVLAEFIEVTGDVTPSENVAITQKAMGLLTTHPSLIACKPNVNVITSVQQVGEDAVAATENWLAAVMAKLSHEGQLYLTDHLGE